MKLLTLVLALLLITVPGFAENIGFDLDDTLSFSTPAFKKGFASGKTPFSDEFWVVVNGSDEGNSTVKRQMKHILDAHVAAGDTVYVITARQAQNTLPVIEWVNIYLGVPKTNVYFSSEKAELIKKLGITKFYGDSDSDITAALEAGAVPVRVLRSSSSSYTKSYTPGKFGEEIVPDSQ